MASSFLRLPIEIRNSIYSYVFGFRTVHVRSKYHHLAKNGSDPDFGVDGYPHDRIAYERHTLGMAHIGGLQYGKCYDPISEIEAYEASQQIDSDNPFSLCPTCRGNRKSCHYAERHAKCWRSEGRSGDYDYRESALLNVSKTVYREAIIVLFANTTFAFELAHTMRVFVTSLTAWCRHLIKNLQFSIHMTYPPSYRLIGFDDIAKAMRSLTGLRTLHVYILQEFPAPDQKWGEMDRSSYAGYIDSLMASGAPWWEHSVGLFRTEGLKDVTVIINDIDQAPVHKYIYTLRHKETHLRHIRQWTKEERAEIARRLRVNLLGA